MNSNSWSRDICFLMLFCASSLYAMNYEKPIIAIHLNVLGKNASASQIMLQALDFKKISKILGSQTTRITSLIFNATSIRNKAEEFAKTTKGTTRIINKLSDYLAQEYNITSTAESRQALLDLAVNPSPDQEAITLLKKLKEEQYITLGISDQDSVEHEVYRTKMSHHGINIDELFNAIITLYVDEVKDVPPIAQHNSSVWVTHDVYPSEQLLNNIQYVAASLTNTPKNTQRRICIIDHYPQAPLTLSNHAHIQRINYPFESPETILDQLAHY